MNTNETIEDGKWKEIERLIELAKRCTFATGQIWLSPNFYRFEVVEVNDQGVATFRKQGSGWHRTIQMRWNSPKLYRWILIEQPAALNENTTSKSYD